MFRLEKSRKKSQKGLRKGKKLWDLIFLIVLKHVWLLQYNFIPVIKIVFLLFRLENELILWLEKDENHRRRGGGKKSEAAQLNTPLALVQQLKNHLTLGVGGCIEVLHLDLRGKHSQMTIDFYLLWRPRAINLTSVVRHDSWTFSYLFFQSRIISAISIVLSVKFVNAARLSLCLS